MEGGEMERVQIYAAIDAERARQEQLKTEGRFFETPASTKMLPYLKACILTEETGEVCAAVMQEAKACNDRTKANVKAELVQVAAIAVAWLESIK